MYPWEYARYHYATYTDKHDMAPGARANLTATEIARLTVIRSRFRGHPNCVEYALDERRLAFARWLVETGRLREEL